MQAARFSGPGDGYFAVTAPGLEARVAQTTYGPIASARVLTESEVVGYSIESATRIVFVVQVADDEWACVAADDSVVGIRGTVFARSPLRDAISSVQGCMDHG
jgi:hypothetical protein